MTKEFLLRKDKKEKKKPIAHSGTFVFARHKSQRFAKPKEPSFCIRTQAHPPPFKKDYLIVENFFKFL